MPYEDKKAVPQRRPHAVTLDERSHLTVTGVDEVVRFDDTEVSCLLYTSDAADE